MIQLFHYSLAKALKEMIPWFILTGKKFEIIIKMCVPSLPAIQKIIKEHKNKSWDHIMIMWFYHECILASHVAGLGLWVVKDRTITYFSSFLRHKFYFQNHLISTPSCLNLNEKEEKISLEVSTLIECLNLEAIFVIIFIVYKNPCYI